MFLVVCYDIPDDGRRLKVARYLEGWGMRVQRSVFEVEINPRRFEEMGRGLARLVRAEEDLVRMYHLCERCIGQVTIIGRGQVERQPLLWVV